MTAAVRVTPRTRPKQAIQWDGSYHSAESITRALNGRVIVWPVPRGYEHRLRREGEWDSSRGDVLEYAAAFLAVYRSESDVTPVRADAGYWFVWDDDDVEILTVQEFDRAYSVNEGDD
ncbi:hypothetical protein SEA_KIKO_58 [Gordonia phage Kiko]|uniref:hypothetical protein n=1 Tax=Gordonia rubripertincta TaxID=36822 RepID=UPI000FDF8785|nr:hypothetical protein [Gordonia rubripertincta]AZV00780.1 hypothetical protein SEA_KIKO_58 [Gordonia phage Kiko]QMU22520.1 hypothetical protein H3V45_08655 [Gordonia rubripertincta]